MSGPNGYTDAAKSDKDGYLSGIAAPYVGSYEITGTSEPFKIGASLLSASETGLNAVEKLHFPEVSVAASTIVLKTDQPLWGWFALAALTFLLVEWWYFQKRPAGVLA